MNNEMIIKTIKLNGNVINIINDKKDYSFDKRDWKAIVFLRYDKDNLVYRSNIHVKFIENKKIDKGQEIILKKSKKVILGKGTFSGYDEDGYAIISKLDLFINSKYNHEPEDLFRKFDDSELKERDLQYNKSEDIVDVKEKYIKGLFKIYYKMLDYSITYLSENVENKYSAMCSYLAVRDCLKNYGIILSNPNCFIKGYGLEYDALLLKKESQRYFFFSNDVKATMEIKVSGIFYKNIELLEKFQLYMKKQHGIDVLDNKDNKNKLPVPHIYITLHESSCKKKRNENTYRLYDECYRIIKNLGNEYIGVFCTVKVGDEQFIIPIKYDLEEILRENKLMEDEEEYERK